MELHGRHILGNETSAAGAATLHGRNPATGEKLPPAYHEASQAEVDHALALAVDARGVLRDTSRA